MCELECVVLGGDVGVVQVVVQVVLGFGCNFYLSGKDYNNLFGQVIGLIDGMKVGNLDMDDGISMGQFVDVIEVFFDNFSWVVFDLVVDGKGQVEIIVVV